MEMPDLDVGSFLKPFIASGDAAVAADGTHDNVEMTGESILLNGDYSSGKLVIGWKAAIATAATLKFAVQHQDSTDGSSWDTAVIDVAATIVKTAAAGAVFNGVQEYDYKLTASKKYIRFNITADLSAGSVDTVQWEATLIALRREGVQAATNRIGY
jgi:hypothetical protein